jgi:cellulose synthase/poly-beta-1,6-N-acetylglucosamine synthase-like glycosyltransferase
MVLVPYRNEVENLPHLLECMANLNVENLSVKFCLVDDHSTDASVAIVDDFCRQTGLEISHLHLTSEQGKKAAIRLGIDHTDQDWILMTDADCRFGKDWIQSYKKYIQADSKTNLVIGGVNLTGATNLFENFQVLEFMSLQASTAGSAMARFPIMCNGANLMVRRAMYQNCIHAIQEGIASGDDMFLLEAIKLKDPKSIFYNPDKTAIVDTDVVHGICNFWNQRIRWVSKSSSYTDRGILAVSGLVFLANLSMLIALYFSFHQPEIWLLLFLKIFSDYLLIRAFAKHSGQLNYLRFYPYLSFLYPFYIVLIAWSSIFVKFQWKERSHNA